MEYHNNKFLGFTLPEVLITIVIIGVVAAMTLSPLITKIRNKGYAERLIKTYSVLQDVTNQIVEENGEPKTWSWDYYNKPSTADNNLKIVEFYKNKLKYVHYCKNTGADKIVSASDYKYLNGETSVYYGTVGAQVPADTYKSLFGNDYVFILNDGVILSLGFQQSTGSMTWGIPELLFTIDVNGKKGPNVIGRDTFFLYLTKNGNGKILPYVSNEASFNWSNPYKDTCKTNLQGYSCAYRIITEGGMNY